MLLYFPIPEGMSKSKLFAKAHIDLNICLGTLVRNPMFAEIEPELHQLAYFKTRIALRNALKVKMKCLHVCMSKSKLFAKAHIDLNICLGTLVRNPMFAEIEPELYQLAYFKTRIALRNALKVKIKCLHVCMS